MNGTPLYWTSCIIQNTETSQPWLCASSEPELTLDRAMAVARHYARNYRCLSVWIDRAADDAAEPATVFHKCLIRPDGTVLRDI